MKIIITALNNKNEDLFYIGNGGKEVEKGLGSGALTGSNRTPQFSRNKNDAKTWGSFISARRSMEEIIDAMRYKDIERFKMVCVHFIK